MELTVMATSMALSIGLGILGTNLMMSMVFSLMTHSVAERREKRTADMNADRYCRAR